jgi:hypothetical protein
MTPVMGLISSSAFGVITWQPLVVNLCHPNYAALVLISTDHQTILDFAL